MSGEWKYGLYVTYNIYDSKWYAFNREDAPKYWSGEPCTFASGYTPYQALNNYASKTNQPKKDKE